MGDNIALVIMVILPIAVLIFALVSIARAAKKRAKEALEQGKIKNPLDEQALTPIEELAFYRQQLHHRNITQEQYDAHEKRIAEELKRRRSESSSQS